MERNKYIYIECKEGKKRENPTTKPNIKQRMLYTCNANKCETTECSGTTQREEKKNSQTHHTTPHSQR